MPDYKELYFKLFRASGQAIETLIKAQQECEQLYLSSREPSLTMIPLSAEKESGNSQKK